MKTLNSCMGLQLRNKRYGDDFDRTKPPKHSEEQVNLETFFKD